MNSSYPTMQEPPALETRGLTIKYGAVVAIAELDLTIPTGSITGVIGPNGAGKTTLLNAFTGFTQVTSGQLWLSGENITDKDSGRRVRAGLMRSFQTVRLLEKESVLNNTLIGLERKRRPPAMSQLFGLPGSRRAEQRDRAQAMEMLDFFGIAHLARVEVDTLPFASRRLVELARVLVSKPKVLLLDEPAAGVDEEARRHLEAVIGSIHESQDCTIVLVEHDVDLVRRLCTHGVALDAGRFVAEGPPESLLAQDAVRIAYFGS